MRLKCICGSTLFYLHYPPKYTKPQDKILYLICNNCQRVHGITLKNVEIDLDKKRENDAILVTIYEGKQEEKETKQELRE